MKRPAKFRVGQVVVEKETNEPFRIRRKNFCDGLMWKCWGYSTGPTWHAFRDHKECELRPLNPTEVGPGYKKEREG